jgi:hypothetical protein
MQICVRSTLVITCGFATPSFEELAGPKEGNEALQAKAILVKKVGTFLFT